MMPDGKPEHLRIVNCFLPQHGDGLEGILEYGIDDAADIGANVIYLSPLFQHGGKSTYANTGGHINFKFVKAPYSNEYNRNLVHSIVRKAKNKDVAIAFDLVLNHISKDSKLFDPKGVRKLREDKVQGRMASAILNKKYTADDMFATPDVKRHSEAKPWNDVREIRLESEGQIQRAIDDFFLPLVDAHLDLVPDDVDEVVFRVDTPSQLLLTNRPNDEGYAVYRIFSAIDERCAQRGLKSRYMLETLGGDPANYEKIMASLPKRVREQTYHFSDSMYGYADKKNTHPAHLRNDIASDNNHDFFRKLQSNKLQLGERQIDIVATHDTPAGKCDLPYYIKTEQFHLNGEEIKRHANFYMAVSYLSAPHYMVTNALAKKDYGYLQLIDTECGHIDFRSDTDTPKNHLKQIGQTHKALYDNRTSFAWNEVAIDADNPDHSLFIFWPDYEMSAAPVYVLHNANPNAAELPNGRDMAEFVKTVAQNNARRKGQDYKPPQRIHLAGEFTDPQILSMTHDMGSVTVNGFNMFSINFKRAENQQDLAVANGCAGRAVSQVNYSPDGP